MCSKQIPQIGGGECDSMLTVPLRGKNPAADSILPTNFIPSNHFTDHHLRELNF